MNNQQICSQLIKNSPSCGESLETENLSFGSLKNNLIYMDKIFSLNQGGSCPISLQLGTATELTNEFLTTAAGGDCNCCCNNQCTNFQLGTGAAFNVSSTSVAVNSAIVTPANALTAANATVDGYAADELTLENGQYVASFNSNLENILKCKCTLSGEPSKAFFLLNNVASWNISLQIKVEGTVTRGSSACCFRACFQTPAATPITLAGPTTFAVPNVSVPCSVAGVSPVFRFRFGGSGTVLNPVLTVTTQEDNPQLNLAGLLIFEPSIQMEVTRPTLFEINASESMSTCDQAESCCGCQNTLELNCQGVFDQGCGCSQGCQKQECNSCSCNEKSNTSSLPSCGNDCCQCNGSNGYRW